MTFMSKSARETFGRAVLAASRPDLCTFCIKPKAEPNPDCLGHQRPVPADRDAPRERHRDG